MGGSWLGFVAIFFDFFFPGRTSTRAYTHKQTRTLILSYLYFCL